MFHESVVAMPLRSSAAIGSHDDLPPTVRGPWVPRTCVWELTLACNCNCIHCGSSAGAARESELTTEEALGVVQELHDLGCEAVTLSGGEPLLRRDWPTLGRAIRASGMRLEMITNGLCVEAQADSIANADFFGVTFSIDGPAIVHDMLRGVPGGLNRLLLGAGALKARDVRIGAVTQINQRNLEHLEAIHDLLVAHHFDGWQLQLTMPAGRARLSAESLCVPPSELPNIERMLLALRSRSQLFIQAADNIGYMSPNEPLLRSCPGEAAKFWTGCSAGLSVVGLTSDGTVRGCLAQPPAANEGNVRQRTLHDIWSNPKGFAYNRLFRATDLRGQCAGCAFGRLCRGGCTSLTWAASPDEPKANPYCLSHLIRRAET